MKAKILFTIAFVCLAGFSYCAAADKAADPAKCACKKCECKDCKDGQQCAKCKAAADKAAAEQKK